MFCGNIQSSDISGISSLADKSDKDESDSNGTGSGSDEQSNSGPVQLEECQLTYSNDGQTVELGKRMLPALPKEIEDLDLDLEWDINPQLPEGLSMNEHTGTISGRVEENANCGI